MQKYHSLIEEIINKKSQEKPQESNSFAHKQLINELKLNYKQICSSQCNSISASSTLKLVKYILKTSQPDLLLLLKEMLQLLYLKQSQMLTIMYQIYPVILHKIIQTQQLKAPELQQCSKVILVNENSKYNRYLKERQQISNNPLINDFFSIHFNKGLEEIEHIASPRTFQKIEEQSQSLSLDRKMTKTVLLFALYQNIHKLNQEALKLYLQAIYIYCGGDLQTYTNISSFYLLQKKNLFNVFKYSISQQELQWMLLSLYELSIDSPKLKYELLAAINMIYKKTANQSMFKYSQIAQSIIHTLEDQYADIFS